jgi:hypothetical protein
MVLWLLFSKCVVLCLILVIALVVSAEASRSNVDKSFRRYAGKCVVTDRKSEKWSYSCVTALFSSHRNFSVSGKAVYFEENKFCDQGHAINTALSENVPQIAVVHRGDCAFDTKAKVAAEGFQGLIIINSDDALFPVGSQDSDFKSVIPVLLVGADVQRHLSSYNDDVDSRCAEQVCARDVQVLLSYGRLIYRGDMF